MAITNVTYIDAFLMIRCQYTRIGQHCGVKGKRADLFSTAVDVVDRMRKEQIKLLLASGVAEEAISEEMLGFPMTWKLFSERAHRHYSPRSFESIIEEVISAGVVRRCYVECHRRKEEGREKLILVCNAAGQPIIYPTIEEAHANRREGGDVVNYFFFNAAAVNDLTAEIYHLTKPTPQPPTGGSPGKGSNNKNGGAQRGPQSGDGHAEQPPTPGNPENHIGREGYLRPKAHSDSPDANIPQPPQISEGMSTDSSDIPGKTAGVARAGSQNCEGTPRKTAREGSQNCTRTPRKTASNKNLIKENLESCLEETVIISAPGAIRLTLSHFDFSQPITPDAIRQLSRILYAPLPEKYRTQEDKEAAYTRVDAAATAIAALPRVQELGLRQTAALMAYQADEDSPCSWRPGCRKKYNNPGFVPRLWNFQSELVLWTMSQEMEKNGWWPDYLPRATGLVETPPEIDLAELAGIEQPERVGMDAETCQVVEEWLTGLLVPHGYEVGHRRVGATRERGYAISVRYTHEDGTRRVLRFYSLDEWYLVVEAGDVAPIGTLDFIRHLSEAVRRNQVA